MPADRCERPGCSCDEPTIERQGKRFCSQACASHPEGGSLAAGMCGCGHHPCGEQ